MNQLAKLYPEGWLRYCPRCGEYIDQSDPQNDSRRKTVIIDDEPCIKCTEQTKVEVEDAEGNLRKKTGNDDEESTMPTGA